MVKSNKKRRENWAGFICLICMFGAAALVYVTDDKSVYYEIQGNQILKNLYRNFFFVLLFVAFSLGVASIVLFAIADTDPPEDENEKTNTLF